MGGGACIRAKQHFSSAESGGFQAAVLEALTLAARLLFFSLEDKQVLDRSVSRYMIYTDVDRRKNADKTPCSE